MNRSSSSPARRLRQHCYPEFPHLIVLRSLTKFYALPGLRLGALVADRSVVAEWRKHREPWQVNVLAEAGCACGSRR